MCHLCGLEYHGEELVLQNYLVSIAKINILLHLEIVQFGKKERKIQELIAVEHLSIQGTRRRYDQITPTTNFNFSFAQTVNKNNPQNEDGNSELKVLKLMVKDIQTNQTKMQSQIDDQDRKIQEQAKLILEKNSHIQKQNDEIQKQKAKLQEQEKLISELINKLKPTNSKPSVKTSDFDKSSNAGAESQIGNSLTKTYINPKLNQPNVKTSKGKNKQRSLSKSSSKSPTRVEMDVDETILDSKSKFLKETAPKNVIEKNDTFASEVKLPPSFSNEDNGMEIDWQTVATRKTTK